MIKSISKRVKISKSGKILRRAMTLGHSRANKNSVQMQRKKHGRNLEIRAKRITSYIN